jgi:hypothetical protein
MVVERGLTNKPSFETRQFSTSAELITEDKGVQYQNDNFENSDPKKANQASIIKTLKEK